MGPVEKALKSDVRELGDLAGVEPSLVQMAYRLAREVDAHDPDSDARILVQLNRELRQTISQIMEGRTVEDDDDGLGDLAAPE
jgi:hypothetical protein